MTNDFFSQLSANVPEVPAVETPDEETNDWDNEASDDDDDDDLFDDEEVDYEVELSAGPDEILLSFRNTYKTVLNPTAYNTVREVVQDYKEDLSLAPEAIKNLYVSVENAEGKVEYVSLDNSIRLGTVYYLSLDQQTNGN